MIKAVLFDFGGVLSQGGKTALANMTGYIVEQTGLPASSIQIEDLHDQLRRAQITTEDFLQTIQKRYGLKSSLTVDNLLSDTDFLKKSEPVYALAAKLRAHGLKTGILSNIYKVSADGLRAGGFYDNFEPVVLSSEEKLAKPEPEFYERALQRLGVDASEVLFVDDQEKCVIAAKAMGIKSILAHSPTQIVSDIVAVLRKENGLSL